MQNMKLFQLKKILNIKKRKYNQKWKNQQLEIVDNMESDEQKKI